MRFQRILCTVASSLLLALPALATVRYVDVNNPNPAPPYTDWATAANVIQVAIDAADPGDLILVTNGVYQSGGHNYNNDIVSRVALPKALTVQSVNGPAVTTILADVYPHYAWGCRGAYLTNGAVLAGFTLSLGNATLGHDNAYNRYGGGVYCASSLSVVSNCVITQNRCTGNGAGGFRGTYINCVFSGNSTSGGYGGGADFATLINCTVVGNSGYCGGVSTSTVTNSIVYFNSALYYPDALGSTFTRSCSPGLGSDQGNISSDPLLADVAGGDFHLSPNSPCINAGDNAAAPAGPDVDGNPRIKGGTVDMGAYEFQGSRIPYAWLQRYHLPFDGSADDLDPDGDGMSNWQEWRCGTDPTDPLSVLKMLAPSRSGAGLLVSWSSVAGTNYFLQYSTNLSAQPAFWTVGSDIAGQAGTTTYPDTNATGPGPFFYRVGVP